MTKIYFLLLLSICCLSCKEDDNPTDELTNRGVVKGEASYIDILTGELIVPANVEATITTTESYNVYDWMVFSTETNPYELGPFGDGEHQLNVTYLDTNTNITYTQEKTVPVSVKYPGLGKDLVLEPQLDRALLFTVKQGDTTGNIVTGTTVYLFANAEQAERLNYPVSLAEASSVSNDRGNVIFKDLVNDSYQVLAIKTFELSVTDSTTVTDTLINVPSSFPVKDDAGFKILVIE